MVINIWLPKNIVNHIKLYQSFLSNQWCRTVYAFLIYDISCIICHNNLPHLLIFSPTAVQAFYGPTTIISPRSNLTQNNDRSAQRTNRMIRCCMFTIIAILIAIVVAAVVWRIDASSHSKDRLGENSRGFSKLLCQNFGKHLPKILCNWIMNGDMNKWKQ